MAPDGIEPGVERPGHILHGMDAHILREQPVGRGTELLAGQDRLRPATCDLAPCMNAGIRAASTGDPHLFTRDLPQGTLDLILHCAAVLLALPTDEIGAVVFEYEF